MVRITSIARSGVRSRVDTPGSIAGVAAALFEARQGLARIVCRDGITHSLRVTDVVMIQLLDGDDAIVEADDPKFRVKLEQSLRLL